ncbi:MAG: Alginate biosynthesis sensor protein KinB, partial [Verrucomicrobiales bacterium]|nr:Alginate biosynthesis sensor protein KinB [Verrucomicrobiales bacterium]
PTELSRSVVKLISETFEFLSVTVWLAGPDRTSLLFGASTNLTSAQTADATRDAGDVCAVLTDIQNLGRPAVLGKETASVANNIRVLNPETFEKGGQPVCIPLLSGGEAVGLILAADRVNGRPVSIEDLDLLGCIANQVAGSFRNMEMAQSLIQNKEIQAFQAMSAFFVHDLKNTASTLSLMLDNLKKHFGNPEFREDCLRGLGRSVSHIDELLKRLADLRHELELKPADLDLNSLVSTTIESLPSLKQTTVEQNLGQLPKVSADPEQLRKVITNLLLNAREAVNGEGQIKINTTQQGSWAQLSISDNGCGMTRDFMDRSLFRPFQSTKKNGLGIGMFHTKTIVEAHRGRIEVESQLGQGTTFRVLLPVKRD